MGCTMVDLDHLSYSSIQTFLNCGENWRRKYLLKEPTPTTPALIFGSAIHSTIEGCLEVRSNGGHVELDKLWIEMWRSKLESTERIDWGIETPEEHYQEGLRLLGNPDLQRMINGIRPKVDDHGAYIERKIELCVPGVPIPIIGYIDIMTNDGVPGDFKTSSRAWDLGKAQEELQPVFYLAALNQAGHTVPGLRFRHYVITKAKKPQVQVLEHQRTWQDIFWLFGLIQQVWRAIQSESFVYGPHSWLCNPKYCNFWSTCRGKSA